MTMGADPLATAAIGAPGGEDLVAFFVRKERKEHGLQRWIEGPVLDPGSRCLVVEDVVTTGGSTVRAIERIFEEGLEVAGVVSVVDRLAGGGEAIEAAAEGIHYRPLITIDELYPERPDKPLMPAKGARAWSASAQPDARPTDADGRRELSLRELVLVAAGACLLAVVMHWPLVLNLGDDIPKDLGDPLAAGLAGRLGRSCPRPPAARLLPGEPVLAGGRTRLPTATP